VIAHGSTRPQALDRLRSALSGLRVHGVATNREALLAMVDDADVRAGRTTIDLLEARADSFIGSPVADLLDRHAVLAALAARADRETRRPSRLLAPAAWRSMTDAVEVMHLSGEVSRAVTLRTGRTGGTTANVDDAPPVDVRTHSWDGERLDVELDGVRRQARVLLGEERDEAERAVHVFADGHASTWTEPARLPAGEGSESARGPSSPVPGTVLAVHVSPGDMVTTGDPLVVLEAMKMEHRITADTEASVVEVVVAVGDAVDAHEVLVVLEPLASEIQET